MSDRRSLQAGRELSDISTKAVALSALLTALLAAALLFGTAYGMRFLRSKIPGQSAGSLQRPPEPRLETREGTAYEALRQGQLSRLNSYGWVDSKNGIARIPVHRAIEVLSNE
jgi:hypothetical protein